MLGTPRRAVAGVEPRRPRHERLPARTARRRQGPRPLAAAARAASARCCSPTSAPRCSRSRTPAWATTCAGRRRTTRAPRTARRSALFLALNRSKRSIRIEPQAEARQARCCCGSCATHDVVLESFRPGVLDRLGVGYERLREENPGLVYCAITGYGQDGPYRDRCRPRHELPRRSVGLLGLTGEAGRPAVQAAGQIADLGGGALMAAFGILAALRERERSGEGQLVDVSMADGALSWLAMVAARLLRRRRRRRSAASSSWPAQLVCYRPYACADGWVALGALEPKFWQAWCRGVGREDLIEQQFDGARAPTAHAEVEADLPRAHARRVGGVRDRARLLPGAGARPRRGARLGAGARARDGRRARPARRGGAGPAARRAGQARRTPGDPSRAPGPGARRAHRRGARGGRLQRRGDRGADGVRRGGRTGRRAAGIVPGG